MNDFKLTIDGQYIQNLKRETGLNNVSDIITESLILYNWAVSESKKGRVLITTDENGEHEERVLIPTLEKIRELNRNEVHKREVDESYLRNSRRHEDIEKRDEGLGD